MILNFFYFCSSLLVDIETFEDRGFVFVTGIIQFVYCCLVGTFPFNSFLSGFISCVGSFVLGACLRIQVNPQNKLQFPGISPERAFADFIFAHVVLHLVVINFSNELARRPGDTNRTVSRRDMSSTIHVRDPARYSFLQGRSTGSRLSATLPQSDPCPAVLDGESMSVKSSLARMPIRSLSTAQSSSKSVKKNLDKTFVTVFQKGDEKTRASLYKLRDTWSRCGTFPPSKLYAIDIKVHAIDRAWPIQQPPGLAAATSSSASSTGGSSTTTDGSKSKSIYVNRSFLNKASKTTKPVDTKPATNGSANRELLMQQLEQKKRELEAVQQKAVQQETRSSSSTRDHHGQLQSVVTVPSSSRDPRLTRHGASSSSTAVDNHRSISSSSSAATARDRDRTDRGSSEQKDLSRQQVHDVDMRNRNHVPSLPPKKRKPQSPVVDSEPETSSSKEKRRRSDIDIKSPNPFGTHEDQDLRSFCRQPAPPLARVKDEIKDDGFDCTDSSAIAQQASSIIPAVTRERTPTRPISPAVQHILAAASSSVMVTTAAASIASLLDTLATTTSMATSTSTTSPAAASVSFKNVRISIDAPELPDRSLGTLVAHRDAIIQRTEQQFNEGQITRQEYNDIMRGINATLLDEAQFGVTGGVGAGDADGHHASGFGQPPKEVKFAVRSVNSTSSKHQPREKTSKTDTTFDPIPANNRIFVDGRAYEVRYIDDVAVIERNGLPHRIYFTGTPAYRDVVVDGIPYTLGFNESKTITIDGEQHVIRFGAPSRELYMGPFPFRGSFGGPPILATINRVQHKIQLCGPPPEVKIDPEPAHELLRYMKQSHMPRAAYDSYANGPGPLASSSQQQHQQQSASRRPVLMPSGPLVPPTIGPQMPFQQQAVQFGGGVGMPGMMIGGGGMAFVDQRPFMAMQQPQPQVDLGDLLSKLVSSGVIAKPADQQHQQSRAARQGSPPSTIPKKRFGADEEAIERRSAEPDLTELAPGLLKIRFTSVIEALYLQKTQCGTCGMRFADSDRQKYSKHLDWHFQQSRRDKDKINVRPWYLASDDWVRYEEAVEDLSNKVKSTAFENSQKEQQSQHGENGGRIITTDSVIPASDDNQECAVCGEKFEQFYDDDEELWKMRNATMIRGKAYHPLCYQDSGDGDTENVTPIGSSLPEDLLASWGTSNSSAGDN